MTRARHRVSPVHRIAALLGCLLLLQLEPVWAAREGALDAGMVNPGAEEHPVWFKNTFLDLGEDLREARGSGKRLLLYFYQDGCPYCKKLMEDNLGQRGIADRMRGYFDVIALNIWGDRELTDLDGQAMSEKGYAAREKVMFTPTLVVLDEAGKPVLRMNGYYPPHRFAAALEYAGGHHEKEGSFADYARKADLRPARGKLHEDPAYLKPAALDAPRKRPLLVLFEQKQCADCDVLHEDIFVQAESKSLLAQFDIVLLDRWAATPIQTPDGKATTVVEWARALGIQYAPALVFFDAGGREVFRSEAWLRRFHTQSVLDYVATGSYKTQPNFQRFIEARADELRAQGVVVDIMK